MMSLLSTECVGCIISDMFTHELESARNCNFTSTIFFNLKQFSRSQKATYSVICQKQWKLRVVVTINHLCGPFTIA